MKGEMKERARITSSMMQSFETHSGVVRERRVKKFCQRGKIIVIRSKRTPHREE